VVLEIVYLFFFKECMYLLRNCLWPHPRKLRCSVRKVVILVLGTLNVGLFEGNTTCKCAKGA
jgi:hypothetical protein